MRLTILKTLAVTAALAALAGCAAAPTTKNAAAPTYVDVARFRAITVESVQIAPGATTLSDADRETLEHRLQLALIDAIPAPRRAAQAGEGVLRLKITVTALDAANPALNGVTATLIAIPVDRGSIAFDATFFDAPGGAAIGSTTVRRKGRFFDMKGNFTQYGSALRALGDWGAGLAGSLTTG